MEERSSAVSESQDRVLEITRIFDAPRSLVFKAWIEPERLSQWIGPRGFKSEVLKMDARPGGQYRLHMRSPGDTDHYLKCTFLEIVEPERLVYRYAWTDPSGTETRPETTVRVTFEELGEKTRLTLHQAVFESVTARDEHNSGWNSCFDVLAEYLAA